MKRAKLVPASLIHVGPLAANMREADRIECEAFGRSPKQALRLSLRTAFDGHALTALDPDTGMVLAMMGVSALDLLGGTGTPWFLGREEVFEYARDLVDRGPKIIAWWHETFPLMANVVAVDNYKAIRLLRRWGATVDGPIDHIGGVAFKPFRFEASVRPQT